MNTNNRFRSLRVLLASAAGAFGIATIIASGGGGGRTDENGNPLPEAAATWFKSFGGPNDDIAYSAIPTRDGGFAFTGMLNDSGQTGDLWLTKLDDLGDVVWQRAYGERPVLQDGLWSLIDTGRAPRQGPDGAIWFLGAGKLDGSTQTRDDLVVAKLNPDGSPAWARSYDSGGVAGFPFFFPGDEAIERPQSITPTADGGALVGAWSYVRINVAEGNVASLNEVRNLWLLKLSSTGSPQWARRIIDDQFMYVQRRLETFEGWEQERIVVHERSNGELLVNVISRLAASFCEDCEVDEFTSTRFLHLRAGGELVLNQRLGFERVTLPFENHDQMTEYALPTAIVFDPDQDNVPEGYLLVGSGWDVGDLPVAGDVFLNDRAALVFMLPNGIQLRREFYDQWPDGTTFETIERKCGTVACTYLLAGSTPPEGGCDRQPTIGEIDLDLEFARKYSLASQNEAQACFNFVPQRMTISVVEEDRRFTDVALTGWGPPRGRGQLIDFGTISARLFPAETPHEGSFVHAAVNLWKPTLSLTPDGQVLGVLFAGSFDDGDDVVVTSLVRTNVAGEVTLSRPLRVREFSTDAPPATRDSGFALAQALDDGFFVLGESVADAAVPVMSLWAIRTDRDGRLLWQRRLPGLKRVAGSVPNVIATADGFLFAGFNRANSGPVVGKLSLTGDVAWIANLPAASCNFCDLRIAVAGNGDVFAVGNAFTGEFWTPWLARVSGAGAIQWMQRFDFRLWSFEDIDVLASGELLVAGRRAGVVAAWGFSANGDPLWNRTYPIGSLESGLTYLADDANTIRADALAAGGFMLTVGVETDSSRADVLLMRAAADGVIQWARRIGAASNEIAHEMRVLQDGGVLLAGRSTSLGDRQEAWIARLGPDGRVSATCNTGLEDYSQRLGTAMEIAPMNLRRATVPLEERPEADTASLPTQVGEFIPNANEVVVARQCLGSAAPENPPPPPARFRLTMTTSSALPGTGAVMSSPAGITCGTPGGSCSGDFDAQAIVTLRPDTQIMESISHWEGCDVTDNGICIVRMTAERTVRLVMRAEGPRSLTITSITGHGSVTDDAALNCNSGATGLTGTCSASYALGAQVTVIAAPGAGQSFQSWGGDCVASANPTRAILVMDANKVCSAVFTGVPAGSPTLTIVPEALGLIGPADPATIGRITSSVPGIDCGSDCSERYPQHSNVTVTAEVFPAHSADWEFERFVCPNFLIPPDQVNGRSASIQLTGDVTCTARFRNTIKRLYLDMTNEGFAQGRVVSDTQRLDCTADCDRPFDTGTLVTLRARPAVSAQFRTWQNCDTVIADPDPGVVPLPPGQPAPLVCVVQMNTTRTVAAFFEPFNPGGDNDRTLTVAFSGSPNAEGMVFSIPAGIECTTSGGTCTFPFASGTVVRLVAGTQPGTLFDRFAGCTRDNPDGDPSTNDCEVNMVDDRFIQIQLLRP